MLMRQRRLVITVLLGAQLLVLSACRREISNESASAAIAEYLRLEVPGEWVGDVDNHKNVKLFHIDLIEIQHKELIETKYKSSFNDQIASKTSYWVVSARIKGSCQLDGPISRSWTKVNGRPMMTASATKLTKDFDRTSNFKLDQDVNGKWRASTVQVQ